MYVNCRFKAFVADAAAKLMAEMVSTKMNNAEIMRSVKDNERMYEHFAMQSVAAAEKLAFELQEYWRVDGDKVTTFFDPDDTELTGIENALEEIDTKLEELTGAVLILGEERPTPEPLP